MDVARGYVHELTKGVPVIACGRCDEERCVVSMWGKDLQINCVECDVSWVLNLKTLEWSEVEHEGDIVYAKGGAVSHVYDR